ncbi:uncharacterized protein LOC123559832 [Mercenaria mercenaria]|uniref:uncharacterized protein LOC123559832 n=1 Tax=Mercenaria mercenaria TaxID=6596 RepID=UPI00234F8A36|nr:uncharacterized protein LOC123559832 [Mercenaria mercenaria]
MHIDIAETSERVGKFGKKVTLHKLPKHQSTRQAWIRAISRKNWKPTSYTRVCSDHFKNGVGPDSVNRNKIPRVNLPQKKHCERSERKEPRLRPSTVPVDTVKSDIIDHHTYCKQEKNPTLPAASSNTNCKDQDSQTYQQPLSSAETSVCLPEITIENIQHSTDLMMFYTGLPDFQTYDALFSSLIDQGADKLSTETA